MVYLTVDIKPTGLYSACVELPFDVGRKGLAEKGYHVISLKENAQLRMRHGKDAFVSRNGNWVKEGAIYIQNEGAFLTKTSPIIANAKEATSCHKSGAEFYLSNAQVQESLADSVKLSNNSIPTNRFAEDPVTVYAFEELADQYGQFLQDSGIESMPVWLTNPQNEPFARQLWFRRLDLPDRSALVGNKTLHYDYRLRGICHFNEDSEDAERELEELLG